jgi:AcrR family transcriptional regulator
MPSDRRRLRLHDTIRREILDTAWEQTAANGAAALSLRAIARQMGLTAPALYRYYPDRDALVTALIVDAFTSFGQALLQAREAVPQQEYAARLVAVGRAYREWALAYPQRYALIFGTPIPGYVAPTEVTLPPAANGLRVLIEILDDAWRAGSLPLPENPLSAELQARIEDWRSQVGSTALPYAHYLALAIWSRVHGLASLELYGQFPPSLSDPGEIYERELSDILRQAGLNR